uniref:Putative secreted protein n=1 Tax=Anopheles triannulatus TaxID=58253 RepID=A0A2M4B2Q6_9DIPT
MQLLLGHASFSWLIVAALLHQNMALRSRPTPLNSESLAPIGSDHEATHTRITGREQFGVSVATVYCR